MEPKVEHYILKGVTLRFVFGLRNFHNRITVKNIAEVTATGCSIYSP